MNNDNGARKLSILLFATYLVILFWIIVFKVNTEVVFGITRSINLIPLGQSLMTNGQIDFSEIILNIIIFLPLGIYAGLLFKKSSFWKKVLLFFSTSFICELSQFILGVGFSDITDIINNTLGGILGLAIYAGIERAFKDSIKTQRFINIAATIVTVLVLLLLLLLILYNM